MRVGCCGGLEQAQAVKDAGFDFLEVNVQSVLKGDLASSEWDKAAPDPAKFVLPVEAANCLVPGSRPIIGPQRDLAGLQDYMQRVAKRAQRLGITRLVFGSGGARKRPEGVDQDTADKHLAEFSRMAAEACAHHDVIVVIEHLNVGETNTLNKLAQARHLADKVGHPALAVLVDSYHYALEKENDEAIIELGDRIRHVHVAEPVQRVQPGAHGAMAHSPDAYDFAHFFCLLRKAGYGERISFEGKWSQPIEKVGRQCVELLRDAWDKAGTCES
ncbi:MAG: sugar phosphate isomerase/epimerase family protein [Phycisphaeraceae bacterium]